MRQKEVPGKGTTFSGTMLECKHQAIPPSTSNCVFFQKCYGREGDLLAGKTCRLACYIQGMPRHEPEAFPILRELFPESTAFSGGHDYSSPITSLLHQKHPPQHLSVILEKHLHLFKEEIIEKTKSIIPLPRSHFSF